MFEAYQGLADFMGISMAMLLCLAVISIWDSVWKLIALWKSAGKKQLAWFICLAIFNTMGILPILYIFIFSKMKQAKKKRR